jgi:hypothetical protein
MSLKCAIAAVDDEMIDLNIEENYGDNSGDDLARDSHIFKLNYCGLVESISQPFKNALSTNSSEERHSIGFETSRSGCKWPRDLSYSAQK